MVVMASEKIVIAVARGFVSGQLMIGFFVFVLLSTDSLSALFCEVMLWVCIERCVGAKPFTEIKATDRAAAAAGKDE